MQRARVPVPAHVPMLITLAVPSTVHCVVLYPPHPTHTHNPHTHTRTVLPLVMLAYADTGAW